MLTTGIFQSHHYPVKIRSLKGANDFFIIPFGDVHWGAPLHSEDYWSRFKNRCKELIARHGSDRVMFIGLGDYQDMLSTSERDAFLTPAMHDSTRDTIEEWWDSMVKKFAKEIDFMRGRCIGLIEGNHFAQFEDGTTSTMRLCKILGCKYLGCSCFARVSFGYEKTSSGKGRHSIDIWAHHGKGAAMLSGGSLNTVEKMAMAADADIYMMGHDHRVGAWPSTRLRLNGGNGALKVEQRALLLVRTGSFLRGYVDGRRSYVADKALNPTQMGWVEIRVTMSCSKGIMRHELHASV